MLSVVDCWESFERVSVVEKSLNEQVDVELLADAAVRSSVIEVY